jgi:hypothetical protein
LCRVLTRLFGVCNVAAVFSKEGYIKKRKANAISELITELCQEVRIHALHLVDAFEVDDFIVHAPLGLKVRRPSLCNPSEPARVR